MKRESRCYFVNNLWSLSSKEFEFVNRLAFTKCFTKKFKLSTSIESVITVYNERYIFFIHNPWNNK